MEKALEELRQKSLSMVAENLEYFNCCKKDFAVSECKLWINKIFDRVNEELEEAMKPKTCDDCEDEMLDADCFPCSYCTRCYQDRYKLKEKL